MLLSSIAIDSKTITSWFVYDPGNPLLFSSALFLGFFLVFYIIYILTRNFRHFRTIYVLLFSLFYYYKAGGYYFSILLGSAFANYILSEAMDMATNKTTRKVTLCITVILNLLVLVYYKYTNFFIGNINTLFVQNFPIQDIILPIGISFFTFQAISYSVDLYRKEIEPARNVLDFSFYLCFFPQLVAGPIVRAKDFMPQMYQKIYLSSQQASRAFFLIMLGLIKKSVISDYISLNFVDRIFENPLIYSPFETCMAVYGYALQIYCDFSGYSDMAIGIALLMGFKLPQNFRTPYKSASVTEFWRRWHISLSSWLRDYLYIPLGGNRKGVIRTYINLLLTMLIGGLWHGASWTFVIWGGLHGTALAVERFFKQFIKLPENKFIKVISIIITFHFIAFCWIFFRATDYSFVEKVLSNISQITFDPKAWQTVILGYKNVFILIAIGFLLHFLPERFVAKVASAFESLPFIFKGVIIGFVFWMVYATASSEPQPFIYFQF